MNQIEGPDVITPVENHPVWVYQTVGGPGRHYDEQHDSFFVTAGSGPGAGGLRDAFSRTSASLKSDLPEKTFSRNGATAVVASLDGQGGLTVGHAGDSRATLFFRNRKTGEVGFHQLTRDHLARGRKEAR